MHFTRSIFENLKTIKDLICKWTASIMLKCTAKTHILQKVPIMIHVVRVLIISLTQGIKTNTSVMDLINILMDMKLIIIPISFMIFSCVTISNHFVCHIMGITYTLLVTIMTMKQYKT